MIRNTTEPIPLKLPRSRSAGIPGGLGVESMWLSMFDFRSSVRAKILLSFVIVSLIAISAVSLVSYVIAKNVVADTVLNGLEGVATHQARLIETGLEHYQEDVAGISNDTQVRQSMRNFIGTGNYIVGMVLNQILSDRARIDTAVESFDLVDPNGEIIASSDIGHLGPADYDPSESGIVISTATIDGVEGRPTIRVSAPIVYESRVIGYATAHVAGDILEEVGTAYVGLRETGEILLITRYPNGDVRFISPLRFNMNNAYYKPVTQTDGHRVEIAALAGSTGHGTEFTDYRGQKVFAAYEYVADADIGLVVKMDETEALSRIGGFVRALGFVIPVIFIVVVVSALLLARQLTRPIAQLTRSAEEFSRGDLRSRVAVDSTDEFGLLAETFNTMASHLQLANSDLEKRVKERTADLRRSNEDLEQFAYVASHDLQEPLRMVTSYTQLLARRYKDQLDDNANEFIDFAVDGAKRMQALINDLLTYSRVGTHENEYKEVESIDIVAAAIANLSNQIEDSGASISIGDLPVVTADQLQLVSLFQNLISNAIKYRHPDRSPWVEITAERFDSSWRFAVTDNGIGIEPAFTDRIFTIFQRLHSREKYQGTGIGLAVARKVVERAGGTIWVTSIPDSGSTFFFTITDQKVIASTANIEDKDRYFVAS